MNKHSRELSPYILAGLTRIQRLPRNRCFVLAEIAEDIPHPDHSYESARLIGEARNRGLIVRSGYGPARRPSSPLAPANVWRRTSRRSMGERA